MGKGRQKKEKLYREYDSMYYVRTWGFMLLCVLIVFLQRWDAVTWAPLTFTIGEITFSTSDFFLIVAAGICGYMYGIGGFVLLFAGEVARTLPEAINVAMQRASEMGGPGGPNGPGGNTGEMIGRIASSIGEAGNGDQVSSGLLYFAMFIYLVLALLSGYFARKRWYKGIKKPLLAIITFCIVLGSGLYITMDFLVDTESTVYGGMSLVEMYVGVIPEIVLAVLVLTLFYRYAPDKVKRGIGEGRLYTKEYEEYLKHATLSDSSALGRRILIILIVQTLLLSGFAVLVFDFQMRVIQPERLPRGMNLFRMNFQLMLLIFCLVMPIAMVAYEIVQKKMVKPLNQMTQAMKNYFSDQEDVRHRSIQELAHIDIQTDDEIRQLHISLCKMVSDMSDYIDVMKREMELKENLAAAEAESKAKSAFLSSMSHEIRTPINAVLGMDEMILRESEDEKTIEYAENIRTAGNSLLGLINDILDFSKIEAGKMDIIPVEYEFASVLNDLVNMIRQRAESKHLQLIVEADSNIPTMLYGDEIRFKQVVTNILTNAVKYTEEGSVTLRVKSEKIDEDNIELYVSVTDTGIGIKEEDIEKLYSAFERIEEERNRNIEGTGLGMNITKFLLEMMDSRLEVQSEYGKGSTFSFHLKQKVVKWEPIGDFEEALRKSYANRKRYHESFTAPEVRILAVDDTRMNLTVLAGLLKKTKVQIDMAESGEECLAQMTRQHYDIIFLDHRMPGMDGVETRARMDELEGNLNIDTPVIALTANAVSGAREEYISYGFTDYLTKPIDSDALEKMMIKYLPKDKVRISTEELLDDTDGDKNEAGNISERAAVHDGNNPDISDEAQYNNMSIEDLPVVEGLDWRFAMVHIPDMELLKAALDDFYSVILHHADRLNGFYEKLPEDDEAWNEYRILVHGMKSSAATIGITTASGLARMLELASTDKNYEVVSRLHDTFIKEWSSYNDRLKGIFGLGENDEPKEEYDHEIVKGLVETVRSSMEEFDTDKADSAIVLLKQYSYPDAVRELMDKLSDAVADVDSDGAISICDMLFNEL